MTRRQQDIEQAAIVIAVIIALSAAGILAMATVGW
jgi:hypothetical protein